MIPIKIYIPPSIFADIFNLNMLLCFFPIYLNIILYLLYKLQYQLMVLSTI